MSRILDQSKDLSGANQHRLTGLFPPPDYVKQASHDQLCGTPETTPAAAYADPMNRGFPCHTKAATWMSALFFQDQLRELPTAQADVLRGRILKQAAYWGILSTVEQLWEKMAAADKVDDNSLPDEAFALVWEAEDGSKQRHYKIRNAREIKAAAAWFERYRGDFSYPDRRQMANKILKAAEQHGHLLDEGELLCRVAGYGACDPNNLAEAWRKRALLVRRTHPDYAAQAEMVAKAVTSSPAVYDHTTLQKSAELMSQFDEATNLKRLYGNGGLAFPEDEIFTITQKQAEDFANQHVQLVTGSVYEKSALERLPLEQVRNWLGDDVANAVSTGGLLLDIEKMAEVLSVLPRPDAAVFDRLAASLSIPLVARAKAAAPVGLPAETLAALAAEYVPGGSVL